MKDTKHLSSFFVSFALLVVSTTAAWRLADMFQLMPRRRKAVV